LAQSLTSYAIQQRYGDFDEYLMQQAPNSYRVLELRG